MPSEAQARITIDKLLEGAGWRFLPEGQARRENIIKQPTGSTQKFISLGSIRTLEIPLPPLEEQR